MKLTGIWCLVKIYLCHFFSHVLKLLRYCSHALLSSANVAIRMPGDIGKSLVNNVYSMVPNTLSWGTSNFFFLIEIDASCCLTYRYDLSVVKKFSAQVCLILLRHTSSNACEISKNPVEQYSPSSKQFCILLTILCTCYTVLCFWRKPNWCTEMIF